MSIGLTNLGYLETHPHRVKFYLVVHQPDVQMTARINGAPSGDPILSLTYDTGSGDFGPITSEPGMTVLIGSTAGNHEVGIVRAKSANATTITIAESSDLRDVGENYFITVLDEHRLFPKFPRTVSETEVYEDYNVAWVSEAYAYGPIPMMGPPAFRFMDAARTPVDIEYDFSDSYVIAGTSISTYASNLEDGTTGTWAVAAFTEEYTDFTGMEGSRTKLTVTDNNGISRMGFRYDFILARPDLSSDYDAYKPISNFFISQPITGSLEGNKSLDFTVYGSDAARTEIREGSHVWIIFESWYGDTNIEIPTNYANRANILFEGWVAKGSIHWNADHSIATFTALPLIQQMDAIIAYPGTLEVVTSPATWYQVSSCTATKAALYLAMWRSTLSEITDIHVPSSPSNTIAGHDWSKGSIKSQFVDILRDASMHIASDKAGQIWIEEDADLLPTASRTALDFQVLLQTKHLRVPLDLPEEYNPRTSYVTASGVTSSGTPYFSAAPGIADHSQGVSQESVENLAIVSQADLNQLSGDYLARANSRYPDFPVPLAGFWPWFDVVPQKRVRVGLGAGTNTRGVNISGTNFLIKEYNFRPYLTEGFVQTEIILCEETDGPDGVTVTYPTQPPVDPILPDPIPMAGMGTVFVGSDKGCYTTHDFSAESPYWQAVNTGLGAAVVKDFVVDPFTLAPLALRSGLKIYAITTEGLYAVTGPFDGGSWVQVLSIAEIQTICSVSDVVPISIDMSPAIPNYIVIGGNCSSGVFAMHSTNGASSDPGDWSGGVLGGDDWLYPLPQEPISSDGTWYASRGMWYDNGYYIEASSGTDPPYMPSFDWNSVVCDDIEKTCLMPSSTAYRLFGYGDLYGFGEEDTIQEYIDLPLDDGIWTELYDELNIATLFGHEDDYSDIYLFRMQFSNKVSQEGWGWVGGRFEWVDYDDPPDYPQHVFYFCLATQDGWDTIKYATQVGPEYVEGVDFDTNVPPAWPCALAYDNHANIVYILVCQQPQSDDQVNPGIDGWWKLYKSLNYGNTFSLANSLAAEWGTDGYFDNASELAHCDIWIPWVSSSHSGGTLFWSVAMMTVNQNDDDPYVTQVYRSTDSGTTYADIGDDGGLTGAITFLGGPYNSSSILFAGCSTADQGVVAPKAAVYVWESGSGWTQWSGDIGATWGASARQNWVVMAMSGMNLTRGLGFREPIYIEEGDDGVTFLFSHEQITWMTYIPDAIPSETIFGPGSISISNHAFGGVPRCIVIGTSSGFRYLVNTLDTTSTWSSLVDSGDYPHPLCLFVNGFYDDDTAIAAYRPDTAGVGAVVQIANMLSDAGVITNFGDAGMGTPGIASQYAGRLLRISPNGNVLVYIDEDYLWISTNSGTTWSIYTTSTFLPTVLAGTSGYGFIVCNLGGGGGLAKRVVYINPFGVENDKTGNLTDISGGITHCCEVVWLGDIL